MPARMVCQLLRMPNYSEQDTGIYHSEAPTLLWPLSLQFMAHSRDKASRCFQGGQTTRADPLADNGE